MKHTSIAIRLAGGLTALVLFAGCTSSPSTPSATGTSASSGSTAGAASTTAAGAPTTAAATTTTTTKAATGGSVPASGASTSDRAVDSTGTPAAGSHSAASTPARPSTGGYSGTSSPSSSVSVSIPPAPTTPVPAPNGGNIHQTVPAGTVITNPPVSLSQTANYGNGVTVHLDSIKSVTAKAQLPGEVSGPGIQLAIRITNASSAAVNLSNVTVDVQDADGTPANFMTATPSSPFTGSVAAGQNADATYVFALPRTYRNPAKISVSYSTAAPIALFVGNAK